MAGPRSATSGLTAPGGISPRSAPRASISPKTLSRGAKDTLIHEPDPSSSHALSTDRNTIPVNFEEPINRQAAPLIVYRALFSKT